MSQETTRNFCIIAHIDHGKSTLADRFLELTGTVAARDMRAQLLDSMDLERERGITIKLQPVAMHWRGHQLNLIDTPGHVDFSYEVSRSLACVEGAILLVDATQGVQAQTLANYELARTQGLKIIPVISKLDLPAADPERATAEICELVGCQPAEVLRVSAKDGSGVPALLDAVVARVPPPRSPEPGLVRSLIFDSAYDDYRGVVCAVRLFDGELKAGNPYVLTGSRAHGVLLEVGTFTPTRKPTARLEPGGIGYVVTGLKDIRLARVGDTLAGAQNAVALPGYREVVPMVFAGFYPDGGTTVEKLRDALGKLKLNDASLAYEGEHSAALGFGYRCGFLGLLHLDVTRERLSREYGARVAITTPSVAYRVKLTNGNLITAHGALELPTPDRIAWVEEPMVKVDLVVPGAYLGALMALAQDFHGTYHTTDYLSAGERGSAVLRYEMPLNAILVDFYDRVKSVSQGYASLSYELSGHRRCQVRRLDILVAEEPAEALSTIVYEDEANRRGRALVERLKELLPRQMFELKIQAAIGGKVIASERLAPMRKDVTAKLYGGDVTRKRKLLEKQKAGKKRLRASGRVVIPPEAYLKLISRADGKG